MPRSRRQPQLLVSTENDAEKADAKMLQQFYEQLRDMEADKDKAAARAQAIRELQLGLLDQLRRGDARQEGLLLQQQRLLQQQQK